MLLHATMRAPLRSRPARIALGVALGAVAAGFLLIHLCADGGAMAGEYRSCRCRGIEWVLYDATAADGPRRTACFGWVSKRTCYQYRDGPELPCSSAMR